MVVVRRGRLGEMNKIIDVANKSFVPVRYEGFDFRERMPKIYAENKDFSDMHFIVEDNNSFKAVAGNLLKEVKLNDKKYLYSIVGTVSTLLEESNKGYMRMLMEEIEKENVEKGVVFSMLTGKRQRYNRYGYERSGSRIVYEVNKHYYKHNEVSGHLTIRKFIDSDLDTLYSIYLSNQPILLREREEFIIDLRISNSTIYTIIDDEQIVGYFAIGDALKVIHELSLNRLDLLPLIMKEILNYLEKEEIHVLVNPLNIKLNDAFELIAEGKVVEEEIMWKVYKWVPFLEMVLYLNKNSKVFVNTTEVYKVDDQIVEIIIKDNQFKVNKTSKPYLREFTSLEFIRFVIGNTAMYKNTSLIFPLALDFNEGDMF